jgi:very-short-patch-repair endonuclease
MLSSDEIVIVDGLAATSEARTWVDLAAFLSLHDLVAVGDSILHENPDPTALAAAVRRASGRRGIVRARAALPLLDGDSRSRPESHLRCVLVDGGLPKPEVNKAAQNARGEWLAEPDLLYRAARLAIEYNGADHAVPKRMRNDITRELDLAIDDWHTLVVGPSEVFEQPERTVAHVRSLLDRRDPLWRKHRNVPRVAH